MQEFKRMHIFFKLASLNGANLYPVERPSNEKVSNTPVRLFWT